MSVRPALDPACSDRADATAIAIANVIDARARDVEGLPVLRLLPAVRQRRVGPFVFFDQMGPATLGPGTGLDVRPHPHIGLATVTYLFDGEIVHRDSLGSHQAIRPGAINWMTAGRGITHSERTGPEARAGGARVHGLQLWVALPQSHEEKEPSFHHHAAETLPALERDGARLRVLAGSAYGERSPVETLSPLFYVDAVVPGDCELSVPADHEERAAFVVSGAVGCAADGSADAGAAAGRMLVFAPGARVRLRAAAESRVVLLGGAPLDGARHVWWNFVSSSRERIERAKRDWSEGRFARIPGDDLEFVPLPD